MKKIIIKTCWDCPYGAYVLTGEVRSLFCEHPDNKTACLFIGNVKINEEDISEKLPLIPDFCPLPDEEEYNEHDLSHD